MKPRTSQISKGIFIFILLGFIFFLIHIRSEIGGFGSLFMIPLLILVSISHVNLHIQVIDLFRQFKIRDYLVIALSHFSLFTHVFFQSDSGLYGRYDTAVFELFMSKLCFYYSSDTLNIIASISWLIHIISAFYLSFRIKKVTNAESFCAKQIILILSCEIFPLVIWFGSDFFA